MTNGCNLCPRQCGADRDKEKGYCKAPKDIIIARAALHFYEEPPISGKRGSGTIFFCGCNLGCVYCQNGDVSRINGDSYMRDVTEDELGEIMLRLESEGAHNINLVTPTPYSDKIARVLEKYKKRLSIPVVYNCGGYESVSALKALSGLVDIYMPDLKYFSPELSKKYSSAPDYCEHALNAIKEMLEQTGDVVIENGIMKKGVIVRHLVLPSCRHDSAKLLEALAKAVDPKKILISIMSQYTPDFAPDNIKELKRRVTSFEYDFVVSEAEKYGFDGFVQEKSSAKSVFTPDFKIKTF